MDLICEKCRARSACTFVKVWSCSALSASVSLTSKKETLSNTIQSIEFLLCNRQLLYGRIKVNCDPSREKVPKYRPWPDCAV